MVKVSVIVPCYNSGEYIEECVKSVYGQTYRDFELIVVDDASTDSGTHQQINTSVGEDSKGMSYFLTENKGVSVARNHGIAKAQGEYILALDADDKLSPDYLEKMVACIESEKADLVCCHCEFFGGKEGVIRYGPADKIRKELPYRNRLHQISLYKKSCWEEFGGYDEKMRGYEDWDFWINFVENGKKIAVLNEVLFYYRFHETSKVHQDNKERDKWIKMIKQNHPKIYKSLDYYLNFCYFRYEIRPWLFQLRTKKGRRIFRLLGVTIYKESL